MTEPIYTFSHNDATRAAREWGCNCGPAALAFALQTDLESARRALPEFEDRRYTNVTMMRNGLTALGHTWNVVSPTRANIIACSLRPTLVRIQWSGPWIIDGRPARWAAKQTHWVVVWKSLQHHGVPHVFDINCGIVSFQEWERETVPAILACYKQADGGWFPTHIWEIHDD